MSDPQIYAQLAAYEKRLKALERQESGAIAGLWTPAFTGSTGNGTFTPSVQVGTYVRLGNVVTVQGYTAIGAFTSAPTGDLRVSGFPFTIANTANAFQSLAIAQYNRINLAANVVQLGMRLEPGTTYSILLESYDDADGTTVQGAAVRSGSIIIFSGSYICEA